MSRIKWLYKLILRSQEIQEWSFLNWFGSKNSTRLQFLVKISNFDSLGSKPTDDMPAKTGFAILNKVSFMDGFDLEEDNMD